jgi:DNA-directed RNA polymerase subunit RPC12/RpoP
MAIDWKAEGITAEDILKYQIKKRPSIWAQYLTKLRGNPYRFEQILPNGKLDLRRPDEIPRDDPNIGLRGQRQFLQQPLDDQHKHKAMQKSRQCGASENETRETLWFGDQHPYTKQVYVFPTFDQVADFSKTRIEEVMKDSPYVKDRMGFDPITGKKKKGEDILDNVRLRRIGNSFLFFRSGHTPKAGEGIDCDKVTFDEIDRMHPQVMIAFNETLSSSAYGWRRDVSTPSLPGVGVNASFQNSDQMHWFMKCPHCNSWFTLIHDWEKHIIELPKDSRGRPNHDYHLSYPWIRPNDTHAYVCLKCGKPISDETRINGIWRPLYPYKIDVRGYQISQLICAWISASQLMKKREDYKLAQLFVNYVIGLPYLGDNVMVTRGDILRCVDTSLTNPYDLRRDSIGIGGDWGNESWGVAGMPDPDNSQKIILMDIWNIKDSDAMTNANGRKDNPHIRITGEKMRQWQARRAVLDAGYGKDKNWELLQDFPSRIFSCFYPSLSTDITKNVQDSWSETDTKVSVDRTTTLKIMAKMFRDQKFRIPAWVAQNPLFGTFIKHITNLVIVRDIDEDPATKKEVIKERIGTLPGGDHFGHAMNYLTINLRKLEDSGKSDFF